LDTLLEVNCKAHSLVIILERKETESKLLNVASLSKLSADQITKLVVRLKGTHGVSGREYSGNVVETITNANIFNYIASVEHIRTDGRHTNLQGLTV
jgi:hypothetical protein